MLINPKLKLKPQIYCQPAQALPASPWLIRLDQATPAALGNASSARQGEQRLGSM